MTDAANTTADRSRRRRVVATAGGVAIGALAFGLTLLNWGFDLTRQAVPSGFAGTFFDTQARALMRGNLALPEGSMGIEGFVIDGEEYMYFPPFPSLLRIPIMLVTDAYDGRLTLLSMAVAWIVLATMTTRLYWLAHQTLRATDDVSRSDAALAVPMLATLTGGTVITFDAALPWAYHEVYLWAVALMVAVCYWLVRVVIEPSPRAIAWLSGLAAALALTRTTGGLAACLTIMAIGVWICHRRPNGHRRLTGSWLILAGLIPVSIAAAVNVAKFGHPFMFPLVDQVWTQVSAQRRAALEAGGGSLTGFDYFPTTFWHYFRPDGVAFVSHFPFIELPHNAPSPVGDAVFDQRYRTGSITAMMPLLSALTCAALVGLLRRRPTIEIKAFRAAMLASLAVGGGVLLYGYLTYRYTSEFVPGLIVGGIIGSTYLARFLNRTGSPRRRIAAVATWTAIALTAGYGIVANAATGYYQAAIIAKGSTLVDYLNLQRTISGGADSAMSRLVTRGEGYPQHPGATDQLYVQGACDWLYLNTGDLYERWVPVQARDWTATIQTSPRMSTHVVPLFTVATDEQRTIELHTRRDRSASIAVVDSVGRRIYGQEFDLPTSTTLHVGLRYVPEYAMLEVASTPGGHLGYVPAEMHDASWHVRPASPQVAPELKAAADRAGLSVTIGRGLVPTLCSELLEDTGSQTGGPR